jgi:glycerol uptake facilitator-like aquaporin
MMANQKCRRPETEPMAHGLARRMGAEAVGTFALVFAGCGAIMVNTASGGAITGIGIGLTFGLVIMAMIYATGHISGAHLNPAVTVAFASLGCFKWSEVPFYVTGQLGAAPSSPASCCALCWDPWRRWERRLRPEPPASRSSSKSS